MTPRLPTLSRRTAPKPPDPPPAAAAGGDDEEEDARFKPVDARLVRRMAGLLAPYKWQYAGGLAVGLAHVVLDLQAPGFTQAIIDHCSAWLARAPASPAEPPDVSVVARWAAGLAGAAGFGPPLATSRAAVATLVVIVLLWAAVAVASVALQRLTILITTGAGERVQFDIRRRVFAHLQALSMSYFDRTKLGRIISRCTSDIASLREINVWGVYTIGSNLLMMAFASAMLLATDGRLFAAVAPLGVVLFVVNGAYLRRASGMWQVTREGYTRVAANMAETITGMRVVTAFHRQHENLDTFNALQQANTENNVRASRLNAVYLPLLDLCGFAGKAVILLFGGYLIVAGRFEGSRGVGAVVAAYLSWDYFMNPIRSFGTFYNQLLMAMAGAERVFSLLDLEPEVRDVAGARPLPRIAGRVEFDRVPQAYAASGAITKPGGTYWFTSLTVNGSLEFNGPTTVYLNGNAAINGTLRSVDRRPENLKIYVIGARAFGDTGANDFDLTADIEAPYSAFVAKNNFVFRGRMFFDSIEVKNNGELFYDESMGRGDGSGLTSMVAN